MLTPQTNRLAPSRRAVALTTVLIFLAAISVAIVRAGQASSAPLTGAVYDVSGAVLPGVELMLEDANQIKWVIASDANGRFEFPAVGPGRYVLEASLAGFRSLRHEFELRDARDWDRAVTLQVGDLRETVTVRADRPASVSQAARPAQGGPVRIGGNIRAPRKVLDVRPVYPPAMREAGLTGVVPIEAVIGRDGRVGTVRVLSAQVHPDFAVAAVDAVRQWRFTPTLLNGAPVDVVMTVRVTFDLSD